MWRTSPWPGLLARLLFVLASLFSATALARVGGGEHYSGPSGDDSGGGGDGAGILFRILIELAIRHPKVGVPLLIVCGVGYVYYQKNLGPSARTRKAFARREAESRTSVDAAGAATAVQTLKAQDPGFELPDLIQRVRTLFLEVQAAWVKRDLTPVRALLSDATFQRLCTQVELNRGLGVRDALADVQVEDVTLLAAEHNPAFDILHLRIRARARDADVPASATDEEAQEKAKRAPLESFVEVWTFVRRPGAQTKPGQSAAQGRCPNCGAPFSGGATNTCEFCKAVVNSGHYDWVLSEITQGQAYRLHRASQQAIAAFRERDPALTAEALEDRASLVFWRWIAAYAATGTGPLAKLATPALLEQLDAELGPLKAQGMRRVFKECAVGAVDIRTLAADVDGQDEASVEIRWSARMGICKADDPAPKVDAPPLHQRSVFVLTRRAGAKTRAENGMATSRCPNCGAPLTDTLTPACDYCGQALASGDRDWVLAHALTLEAWRARQSRRYEARALAPPPRPAGGDGVVDPQERARLLSVMAAMAASDGEVDARERRLLKMCAERWSVPWETVSFALEHGEQLFAQLVPRGGPEAEDFLRTVVQMALIDGRVDRKERRLLEDAARHLGIPEKLPRMLD